MNDEDKLLELKLLVAAARCAVNFTVYDTMRKLENRLGEFLSFDRNATMRDWWDTQGKYKLSCGYRGGK